MPFVKPGDSSPLCSLKDIKGEVHSLSEVLSSGPILLAFFKVSCPTCQFTFPFLQRLDEQFKGQPIKIWGIGQDNAAKLAIFASTFSITFPLLIDDAPYPVSSAYGLSHVPSLFLVGKDGKVEISGEGFSKSEILSIQRSLAQTASFTPPELFLPTERIPDFKPG